MYAPIYVCVCVCTVHVFPYEAIDEAKSVSHTQCRVFVNFQRCPELRSESKGDMRHYNVYYDNYNL